MTSGGTQPHNASTKGAPAPKAIQPLGEDPKLLLSFTASFDALVLENYTIIARALIELRQEGSKQHAVEPDWRPV